MTDKPAKKIEQEVAANVEALEKLSASSVASIVVKEENIEQQEKDLELKLQALKDKKVDIKKEKAEIASEFEKLPAYLATKVVELQALDSKIKALQNTRTEQAKNIKPDMISTGLKEDFINKVLGIRGFGTSAGTGEGGKKGELEPAILAILDKHPTGIKKSELVNEVVATHGYNKGAVSRVLADESKYVAGGTLVQRGVVKKEGDLLVKV